jgi:hypothetical protein
MQLSCVFKKKRDAENQSQVNPKRGLICKMKLMDQLEDG